MAVVMRGTTENSLQLLPPDPPTPAAREETGASRPGAPHRNFKVCFRVSNATSFGSC
jgi:hypothetical protein